MKKNYSTPTVEIDLVNDVITTSGEVETERMPLGISTNPTGASFAPSDDFFNF